MKRYQAVDVLRGVTVLAMLLVNLRVSQNVLPGLKHQDWPREDVLWPPIADWIFPQFLFLSGFGVHETVQLYRALKLFIFGFLLNCLACLSGNTVRVMGVLQRIAICNLLCSSVSSSLKLSDTKFWIKNVCFLMFVIAIWVMGTVYGGMIQSSSSGCQDISWLWPGIPTEAKHVVCSAQSFWDRLLLGDDRLHVPGKYDPEGILSTFPACINVLVGCMTRQIVNNHAKNEKAIVLVKLSIAATILYVLVGVPIPVSKTLWTPSYSFITSAISLMLLSFVTIIVEIKNFFTETSLLTKILHLFIRKFAQYGRASLRIYIFSEVVRRVLNSIVFRSQRDLVILIDSSVAANHLEPAISLWQWIPLTTMGRLLNIMSISVQPAFFNLVWTLLISWIFCETMSSNHG